MRRHTIPVLAVLLAVLAAAAPSHAQLTLNGWGPRVGFSDDPGQIFGGVHFDLGELFEQVRFQPNFELGTGDDLTRLAFSADGLWIFDTVGPSWRPYAGLEVALTYLNFDVPDELRPQVDTSSSEVGILAVGGVEFDLVGSTRLMAEVKLGLSDAPDLQVLTGVLF